MLLSSYWPSSMIFLPTHAFNAVSNFILESILLTYLFFYLSKFRIHLIFACPKFSIGVLALSIQHFYIVLACLLIFSWRAKSSFLCLASSWSLSLSKSFLAWWGLVFRSMIIKEFHIGIESLCIMPKHLGVAAVIIFYSDNVWY